MTGYGARLRNTQTGRRGALRLIGSRDTPEAFFYCGPPHAGADQGRRGGYTQDDFERLLDTLSKIQGKFLLSSCRNKALPAFIEKQGWDSVEIRMNLNVSGRHAAWSKIGALTAGCPIADKAKAK
jgi:DNA adenine methylase